MKILITHAYSKDNKGDAAILSVLLTQLKNIYKNAKIIISIDDDAKNYNYEFEGTQVITSPEYLAFYKRTNITRYPKLIFFEICIYIWCIIYRLFNKSFEFLIPKSIRESVLIYKECDLIVPIGGGYITAKKGIRNTINLILLLNPLLICEILNKKIILYTQSIGPLSSRTQEYITKWVLNKTNMIFIREDHTLKLLNKIKVKKKLIKRTVDAGFLFNPTKNKSLEDFISDKSIIKNKIIVGITVRKWLKPDKQIKYEKYIATFIDKIVKNNSNIIFVFIPQVTSKVHDDDDRDIASRLITNIHHKSNVINLDKEYSHNEIKDIYTGLDFLIGTRFHSVIFSLTSYVPAIAIEYEYKTSGIMKDLDLSKWVIPIEDVTDKNLYEKFNQIMKNKDDYKEKLNFLLPSYINQAREVENTIRTNFS